MSNVIEKWNFINKQKEILTPPEKIMLQFLTKRGVYEYLLKGTATQKIEHLRCLWSHLITFGWMIPMIVCSIFLRMYGTQILALPPLYMGITIVLALGLYMVSLVGIIIYISSKFKKSLMDNYILKKIYADIYERDRLVKLLNTRPHWNTDVEQHNKNICFEFFYKGVDRKNFEYWEIRDLLNKNYCNEYSLLYSLYERAEIEAEISETNHKLDDSVKKI